MSRPTDSSTQGKLVKKPKANYGRVAQDGHLDFHTAHELCSCGYDSVVGMAKVSLMHPSRSQWPQRAGRVAPQPLRRLLWLHTVLNMPCEEKWPRKQVDRLAKQPSLGGRVSEDLNCGGAERDYS